MASIVAAGVCSTVAINSSDAASAQIRYDLESAPTVTSNGDSTSLMPSTDCNGSKCVVFNGNATDDSVTFNLNVPDARPYDVALVAKNHSNRGIAQLSIAGATNASYDGGFRNVGSPFDTYSAKDAFTSIALGTFTPGSSGKKQFKFTITGHNAASSGYTLGLDAILLTPKPIPTTTTTTQPAPTFLHPGIVNSQSQLNFVKAQIAAKNEPWTSDFNAMKASKYASASYTPHPHEVIGCGASTGPDEGCHDETDDAQAAYTQALMYSYIGDKTAAENAIKIMNAWSSTIKSHKFDVKVYQNGRLQSAWATESFTKAAEIIRYSNAGWSATDVSKFESMLNTAYLPMVQDGWLNGNSNWVTSMADATIDIGVFTNNRDVFNNGVGDWNRQIVGAIYLKSDGTQPKLTADSTKSESQINAYWYGPSSYPNGLEQETCRDMGHVGLGMASIFDAAETASIQGVDLYGQQQQRLTAAMEYNTKYLNNPSAAGWVCPAPVNEAAGSGYKFTWAIGYHHYASRGVGLPETKKWIATSNPTKSSMLFLNWEDLTHGMPR